MGKLRALRRICLKRSRRNLWHWGRVPALAVWLYAHGQALLPKALLIELRQLLMALLYYRWSLVWALYMILVTFLIFISGITLTRITTTRGIELFQSLCRITLQGGSVRAFLSVRVPSASYLRSSRFYF